jgi:hypothetical protein
MHPSAQFFRRLHAALRAFIHASNRKVGPVATQDVLTRLRTGSLQDSSLSVQEEKSGVPASATCHVSYKCQHGAPERCAVSKMTIL